MPGSFGTEAARDSSIKTAPAMPDQHVYIDAYFALLLTPEATPPPARLLVATAIRGLMEYNSRIGQTLDIERTPPVPPGDNQAIQQYYGIWKAVFNAERLSAPIGTLNGEYITKRQL